MSTPIGHSLAGYLIYCVGAKSVSPKKDKVFFAAALVTANLPDFDFIPGLVLGQPNLYHHGISHSIGFGLLASFVIAWAIGHFNTLSFGRNFFFFCLAYGSHLLLDYFTIDTRPPFGFPVLWPLRTGYFLFPDPFLPSISHAHTIHSTTAQFVGDAFSFHNLSAVFVECGIMLPIFLIIYRSLKNNINPNNY